MSGVNMKQYSEAAVAIDVVGIIIGVLQMIKAY